VVGQVTMSLMLVITAGLLLRSLQQAAHVDPGFDDRQVDVASFDLSLAGYTQATARPFIAELLARSRALPGVTAATMGMDLPLDGGRMGMGGLLVAGVQPPRGLDSIPIDWNVVEPGWFDTLKLPLVRGRDFSEADTETAPPVAILNEAAARAFWPGQDPIGRQVTTAGSPVAQRRALTIVGIAKDARLMSLGEPAEPYIYVPVAQMSVTRVHLLVRTADGHTTIPQIREIVRTLNPNLPVNEAMPLSQVTAIGLVPQRIAAAVAGSLGLVGLLLAAIGIYGVTSYAVSRRTREIGIRVALGANEGSVLRLVLRQGLLLAGIGVALGVAIAAVGSRLLASLLFGIGGLDPVTFGGACALFGLVTLVATYIPARRATTVDPMIALRDQ
jgi:predicted permease